MVGNQILINSALLNHKDIAIKGPIGEIDAMKIIYTITDEYWKEWRKQLISSHTPHIKAEGLGMYSLMYGKSRTYLRKMIKRIKVTRLKYADTYLIEGTRGYNLHNHYIKRFRDTWKQVDEIKKEVVFNLDKWKKKKIAKYGDKAIL